MLLSSEEEILEAAIAGLPRIAEVIASIPTELRPRAFDAATRSYLQTAHDLGYAETAARKWAAAVMFRLRAQVQRKNREGSEPIALGTRSVIGQR